MTEAIYFDIDGTLRDERFGIPRSTVLALTQCRKEKIKSIVCTGRNPASIQNDVRCLPLDGIISGGGSYIQYHGELLWKKHFRKETVNCAAKQAEESSLALALETEQSIYMNQRAVSFYRADIEKKVGMLERKQRERFLTENKIRYENNMEVFHGENAEVHKMCIIGDRTDLERLKTILEGEAQTAQEKYWNGSWYLEIVPQGCDKGNAVRELNRRLGISARNTISFGDSENDIAMMRETRIAVAVGDCALEVRRHATSVCEPVMEDGIYKELIRRNVIRPN